MIFKVMSHNVEYIILTGMFIFGGTFGVTIFPFFNWNLFSGVPNKTLVYTISPPIPQMSEKHLYFFAEKLHKNLHDPNLLKVIKERMHGNVYIETWSLNTKFEREEIMLREKILYDH